RHPDPDEQRGDGDHEAGKRSGDTDVEQHAFLRYWFADADECAERAGNRDRHGQEERQRRVDVIIAARDVVSEFVAAENGEDRRAVPESARGERGAGERYRGQRPEVGDESEIVIDADPHRRDDGQEEQQDMQPDAVLKLGPRLPHDLRRHDEAGIVAERFQRNDYPMFWRSLPGLKRIVRPGGMRTSLPVRGLRPIPRLRGFTWKTPKPRSSMRSPRCMETRIASNTASTATSALTLVMSAMRETSFTMSTLIMLRVS